MISIQRKLLCVRICNQYFVQNVVPKKNKDTLTGFSHANVHIEGTEPLQTVYIDLLKSEETLLMEIEKENRRQIRKAEKQQMQYIVLENPTASELKKFQRFYNRHAKLKNTYRCGFYHIETMKKLAEKGHLVFTYMADQSCKMIYCYRVYVTDGEMAMTLYSASNTFLKTLPKTKRQLSEANRFLIWKNMIRFKMKGVKVLDMGGLTDEPSIRKFKTGFGGVAVTVYSGYTANTIIGKLTLILRNQLLGKSRRRNE
ncbi:hypothetical protein ACFQ38_08865 [Sporosarcina contaminans]|uniref:BioF2-like acetyltransferase domain-containing protein n=2 Tax=Sporosarcina TaxID=1569 RepID=A0ABW3TXZ9_9BACL